MKTSPLKTTLQFHLGANSKQVEKIVGILQSKGLNAHLLTRMNHDYSVQIDTTVQHAEWAIDVFREVAEQM